MFSFLNVYKKDLQEFATEIKGEAKPLTGYFSKIFSKETSQSGEKRKKDAVVFDEDFVLKEIDSHEEEKAKLEHGQEFPSFEQFCKEINIDEKTEEITQILETNQSLKEIHTKYVPTTLYYEVFWQRFFYRKKIIDLEREKQIALKKLKSDEEEKDLTWDDEDDNKEKEKEKNEMLLNEIEKLKKENSILKSEMGIDSKIEEIKKEKEKQILEKYEKKIKELENKLEDEKKVKNENYNTPDFDKLKKCVLSLLENEKENLKKDEIKEYFKELTFLFENEKEKDTKEEDYDDWE